MVTIKEVHEFEVGKTYKIIVERGAHWGNEKPSFVTLTIESEDEIWVRGKDKNGVPRGIKKEKIIEYNRISENRNRGEY